MDQPRLPITVASGVQRGNYISVRQKPDQDAGWGTLNRPKPFEMPMLGRHELHTRLGYEAEPSSEVWRFRTDADLRLQVTRRSEDRMANCVAVALLDGGNRHVAPLVATARGVGAPVLVPAGEYRIIASLGIAEQVSVTLLLEATPARGLQGVSAWRLPHRARLLSRESTNSPALSGAARSAARGTGTLMAGGPRQSGVALVMAYGQGLLQQTGLKGQWQVAVSGQGLLRIGPVATARGESAALIGGTARLATVQTTWDPDRLWRARRDDSRLEVNGAYFQPDQVELARAQLADAGL